MRSNIYLFIYLFRQPPESEGNEERSIREFESPQQMIHQQYQQHYQQGYYDSNSQNIDDSSVRLNIVIRSFS
jgi:hypothetical protein